MATFRKRGASWSAQVVRVVDGKRLTKAASFGTKAEAQAWAARTETELLDGRLGRIPDKTVADLLTRYRDEVSITKRGEKWERARIGLTLRDPISQVRLADLRPSHIAAWRDRRLREISAASVRRDWNLLSAAFSRAAKEWHWLAANPMADVKRPAQPAARDRRPTQDEIDRLLLACGADTKTKQGRVGQAMLFAIETGMRAGEIVALLWSDVNTERRFLSVRAGKTAAASRQVPLSQAALAILADIPREGESVFGLSSAILDALFRKAKARALVEDLHFHDLRHEAITRLARKLNVLELARMVGHRDLRMLQIYYNEHAEEIAKRL